MSIVKRIHPLSLVILLGLGATLLYPCIQQLLADDVTPAVLPEPAVPAGAKKPLANGYEGGDQCYFCHRGAPVDEPGKYIANLDEFKKWKEFDVHSHAGQSLVSGASPIIDRMEATLRKTERGEKYLAATDAKCLNCHATGEPDIDLAWGVSCEACHGKASGWISAHHKKEYLRNRKPLAEQGMIDIRDPHAKAQRCSSCHIGDAAQDRFVTHEMYAAGHPPLPGFELTGFENLMPAHWTTLSKKPAAYQKQYAELGIDDSAAKQSLIGGLVGLRSYLNLLAAKSTGVEASGPELALYDCYSCHHDLQKNSWRQARGYPHGQPGRPSIRPFPLVLAKLAAEQIGQPGALDEAMKPVYQSLTAAPFGEPKALSKAAGDAGKQIDSLLTKLDDQLRTDVPSLPADILVAACKLAAESEVDYESTRQLAWTVSLIQSQLAERDPRWTNADIKANLAKLDAAFKLKNDNKDQKTVSIQSTSAGNLDRLNQFEKLAPATASAARTPDAPASRSDVKAIFGELQAQFAAVRKTAAPGTELSQPN